MSRPRLILASSSPYRRALLERLGLEFSWISPEVDESRQPGESPIEMVRRLAQSKARQVASGLANAVVIGSDQCAEIDGDPVGKPGTRDANIAQLKATAGRWVNFLTAVCVVNTATQRVQSDTVAYAVELRQLSDAQIAHYVDREQPFDCAGGFKSEGLGISLFNRMRGDDPTALVGLPLIRLRRMLELEGLDPLADRPAQTQSKGVG